MSNIQWVQQITVSKLLLCPAIYTVMQNAVSTLVDMLQLYHAPLYIAFYSQVLIFKLKSSH